MRNPATGARSAPKRRSEILDLVAVEGLQWHVAKTWEDVAPNVDLVVAPSGRAKPIPDSAPHCGKPFLEVLTDGDSAWLDQPAVSLRLLDRPEGSERLLLRLES